jgi:hypothetical protein
MAILLETCSKGDLAPTRFHSFWRDSCPQCALAKQPRAAGGCLKILSAMLVPDHGCNQRHFTFHFIHRVQEEGGPAVSLQMHLKDEGEDWGEDDDGDDDVDGGQDDYDASPASVSHATSWRQPPGAARHLHHSVL